MGASSEKIVALQAEVESLKQQLRRCRELKDQVQRVTNLGAWEWDYHTSELYWSDQLYRICGLQPGSVRASLELFHRVVHRDDRVVALEHVDRSIRPPGTNFDLEHRIVWPDGQTRTVHARGEVLRDLAGNPLRMVGVVQDITQRRAMEEETQRLAAQVSRLERIAAASALAASLTHELTQPVAALSSYLQVMRSTSPVEVGGRRFAECLDEALVEIDRATSIIERWRGLIRQRPPHTESVNLRSLVEETMKSLKIEMQSVPIRVAIRIDPEIAVRCDRVHLAQVISNLGRNAIEAMACCPGRNHRLLIQGAARGEMAEITVRDSGTGIDPTLASPLFTPLVSGKPDGAGLGLVICRLLIEANGGTIRAESFPGHGAAFAFTLPLDSTETLR